MDTVMRYNFYVIEDTLMLRDYRGDIYTMPFRFKSKNTINIDSVMHGQVNAIYKRKSGAPISEVANPLG